MGTPGAEEVRSISKFGLSMVTVVFDDAVPVYLARQLVTERVNEARSRIPPGAEPTLGPVATAFGEIYQYLVEGDDASVMARKTLHDWAVRNRLRAVPGRERDQHVGRPHRAVPRDRRPAAARALRRRRCRR